jgi:hypothetical protein
VSGTLPPLPPEGVLSNALTDPDASVGAAAATALAATKVTGGLAAPDLFVLPLDLCPPR